MIKKLRRRNLGTHTGANHYLEQEYLAAHHRRFARAPAAKENFHQPAPLAARLRAIFRRESQRVISNDGVVSEGGRSLQLQRQSQRYAPAQAKVTVWDAEEGSLEGEDRGQTLEWKEITCSAPRSTAGRVVADKIDLVTPTRPPTCRREKPAANPPWRRGYDPRRMQQATQRTPRTNQNQNQKRGHF